MIALFMPCDSPYFSSLTSSRNIKSLTRLALKKNIKLQKNSTQYQKKEIPSSALDSLYIFTPHKLSEKLIPALSINTYSPNI